MATETDEQLADALGETAGEVEPLEVLAVAGDESRRVPRREPHPLLLVELGVRDRPEVFERRDHRWRHPGTFDRQHRAEPGSDHRGWGQATTPRQLLESERRSGVDRAERLCELRHGITRQA